MTKSLSPSYSNVLDGTGNKVSGNGNLVIGSGNKVNGKHSWVFSTNYVGNATGMLVVANYKIDIEKI